MFYNLGKNFIVVFKLLASKENCNFYISNRIIEQRNLYLETVLSKNLTVTLESMFVPISFKKSLQLLSNKIQLVLLRYTCYYITTFLSVLMIRIIHHFAVSMVVNIRYAFSNWIASQGIRLLRLVERAVSYTEKLVVPLQLCQS